MSTEHIYRRVMETPPRYLTAACSAALAADAQLKADYNAAWSQAIDALAARLMATLSHQPLRVAA